MYIIYIYLDILELCNYVTYYFVIMSYLVFDNLSLFFVYMIREITRNIILILF